MRCCIRLIVLLLVALAEMDGVARHTSEETNRIVRASLGRVRFYASIDDFTRDRELRRRVCPNTWEKFLGAHDGWTLDECRTAFDWYLGTLGSSDLLGLPSREQDDVLFAVSQCGMLRYTNSIPALMSLTLNTNGVHRDVAVSTIMKISSVNDDLTRFVELITTNRAYAVGMPNGFALCEYGKKLCSRSLTNTVEHARAVEMFFRSGSVEVAASVACDIVLTNFLQGYSVSSNRLNAALLALEDTELVTGRYRDYLVSITNELLSSGQPLRQLNIGDGQ